jgi:excisionase family DNA binding protein
MRAAAVATFLATHPALHQHQPRRPVSRPERSEPPDLMTPREAADVLSVHPVTLTRWADEGQIDCVRTLGRGAGKGHRRFYRYEIDQIVRGVHPTQQTGEDL